MQRKAWHPLVCQSLLWPWTIWPEINLSQSQKGYPLIISKSCVKFKSDWRKTLVCTRGGGVILQWFWVRTCGWSPRILSAIWWTLIVAQIMTYTVVICGRLDTRVEARYPGGVSISCLASSSRNFSYSEIVFILKYSWSFLFTYLDLWLWPCYPKSTGFFI